MSFVIFMQIRKVDRNRRPGNLWPSMEEFGKESGAFVSLNGALVRLSLIV